MRDNMKGMFGRVTVIALLGLGIVSCTQERSGDDDADGPLYVFNWTDYIGDSTLVSFQNRTGRSVRYDNYASNEELLAKLSAGGSGYDVIFPSGYAAEILIERGLLQPLRKELITNIDNVMDEFSRPSFDPEMNYCVPYTWSTTGIGYDSTKVRSGDVQTWAVLWNPNYAGSIMMLDDMRATIGMALKYLGHSANSTDSVEINEAVRLLERQKPYVHVYADANIPQLFSSGEVHLGYGWSGDIRQASSAENTVAFAVPDEGTVMYVDYMCIPASSQRAAAASTFIAHVLSPEISLDIVEQTQYATTNRAAFDASAPERRNLWAPLMTDGSAGEFEFVRNVGEAIRFYDAGWQRLKSR